MANILIEHGDYRLRAIQKREATKAEWYTLLIIYAGKTIVKNSSMPSPL